MGKGSQLWGLWIQLCGRFRRLWLFPSIVAFPFSGELLVADVDHHFLCHTDTLNQCKYHRLGQSSCGTGRLKANRIGMLGGLKQPKFSATLSPSTVTTGTSVEKV
jgi:hypothetical protein